MKIAHVCPFYEPAIGGVKQVVKELAKRQKAEGHDVHIFTSDWDKEKRIAKLEETIDGIFIHRSRHFFRVANFATIWPQVLPKLVKGKFDIIHSHLFAHPHFIFSALAAKISGAAHIHTTHCPWSDSYRSPAGRIALLTSYHTLSRIALKFTDKIIAITPWEKKFIKKFGGKNNQIIVLPNGMDKIFFQKIRNNDFKKNLGIKGPMILFFGRLSRTKSPDRFVEIAQETLKDKPDLTFVLVGPDEGLKEKVIEMIGNEKRIKLLGPLSNRKEVAKMYQAADIFLLPSYREGLPLTLFEAMASGLPIVATPVNGVPYEMKEPENGFLVNHKNVKKFKKRILEFLNDKDLMENVSKNNIEKAKNYSWDIISRKTLKVYEEARK
ncbi:MAG: glycosyltransferase family 4 protein [Nanoarchaeota archaeon]|nr:glycosyltransferase family 4 protein [Nanoarchaeota archaeon]